MIRKHPNPEIRNILIIAMTASAIQGDREKCLDSGMNNYLAKPVRAQTLKALLESYLSKAVPVVNLESEAAKMVREALVEADKVKENGEVDKNGEEGGEVKSRTRPPSLRMNTIQRWHSPNGRRGSPPASPPFES